MMGIVKTSATFALAGVMLAVMLLTLVASLMLFLAVYDKVRKTVIRLRAAWRYKRAKKQQEEQNLRVIRHGREE